MTSALQQRGETAILGVGPRATTTAPALPAQARSPFPLPLRDSMAAEARPASTQRGIARRKLRRRENARLSSNPHVVLPSATDYALHHPNARKPSFPLPPHLQHIRLPSRNVAATSAQQEASSSTAGHFTMTYADAHYFLAHRLGIRPGQDSRESTLGVLQTFAMRAEAELQAWLDQDVFLAPDVHVAPRRDTLIDLNSHDDERDLRIVEVGKTAHNMVWEVPDAFLRLLVHCLARVHHCPTFSKDSMGGRQTWILNPRPGRGRVGGAHLSHSMLDTPPTTDVGTDVASDMASEVESEWAMSDGEGEDTLLVERDDSSDDGVIVPYRIDEEDDGLADVEDG